jgi:hypothetical protein
MSAPIKDLIRMRDAQSLYELMAEDEDWMNQLDAAEGLVQLGDRRGLEFLLSAQESEEKQIRQAAREILDSPELASQREALEAEDERAFQEKVQNGKARLEKGRKVFIYKMVYIPAGEILYEDPAEAGFQIPALDGFGLEGWEVIHILPRRRQMLVGSADENFTGAYFLLKKEVAPEESSELDSL